MDLHRIAIRALFGYLLLLVLLRLSGKRDVGQGRAIDFVLVMVVGDMVDDLLWAEVAVSQFVVGAGALVMTQILVGIASSRLPALHVLLNGKPALFMKNGKLDREGMREEQITELEVEELIRGGAGLEREGWSGIKEGTMELNGRPGVLLTDEEHEVRHEDLEHVKRMLR